MKLEFYPVKKLKKDILEILGKHLDLKEYKIFFFGSRVKGTNFPRADIDIGIIGPEEIPAKTKFEIEEKIEELPALYKIDIVDFKKVPDKFKKEAFKNIEYIK